MLECLPVDPATWVGFPAGAGKIFSFYDIKHAHIKFQGCRGKICMMDEQTCQKQFAPSIFALICIWVVGVGVE